MPPVDEDTKSLCDSIAVLTERRLEFDNKLRERASARPATGTGSPRCAAASSAAPVRRAGRPPGGVSEQEPVYQQQTGALPILGRVTYMKLQGDQLLHLAEMAQSRGSPIPEFEGIAAEALEAYLVAQQVASGGGSGGNGGGGGGGGGDGGGGCNNNESGKKISSPCWVGGGGVGGGDSLPQLHPLRIELALRISSVLLHMLRRPIEAWEAAYSTYLVAAERPARLGPRGLVITQLLRDHLALIDVRGVREDGGGHHGVLSASGGTASAAACGLSSEGGCNEWSFLRVSDGLCGEGGSGVVAGAAATGGDKLRALARVRQARAATDGVVKVLLGTMERAGVVHAALKKIFATYTEKHGFVVPACKDDDGSNRVWLLRQEEAAIRRSEPPPRHHGALLFSWSGFMAICRDFKIATTTDPPPPPSPNSGKLDRTPRPSVKQQRLVSFASSSQTATTRQLNSDDWKPGEGYLLDVAQARIAFVSACTHGSVVASFPEEDRRAPTRASPPGGPPCERGPGGSSEEVYWQDMERVVLSGSTPDGIGLNFPQLVDALARCGLIGFPAAAVTSEHHQTGLDDTGFGGSGIGHANLLTRRPRRKFSFAAERAQALFVAQMRLLDGQHVDATLLLRAEEEEAVAELCPESDLGGLQKNAGRAKVTAAGAPGGTKSKHQKNVDNGKAKSGTGGASVLGMRRPGGNPESKVSTLTPIQARGKVSKQARPRSTPSKNGLHRSKSGAT